MPVTLKLAWILLSTAAFHASSAAVQYHRYPGAVHVHTQYSDGSGTFQEVTKAAEAARLHYVIFTDHNTLKPLKDGHERYWDRVLALVGTEITSDSGHILALDVPPGFTWTATEAQPLLNRIRQAGGMAFLAHPMAQSWRWTDWKVNNYTGLEVLNLAALVDDDLRTAMHRQAPGRRLREITRLARSYLSNPGAVMERWTNNPVEPERTRWDRLLSQGRQVVGIASVDAHARIEARNRILKIPTYQQSFQSAQTYVVTPEPLRRELKQDRKLIYDAFRNGRLYMVYAKVAAAPEFSFTAEAGRQQVTMGQPIRRSNGLRLTVSAPGHPRPYIRLLKDGVEIAAVTGERLEREVMDAGAYRAEVYVYEEQKRSVKDRIQDRIKDALPDGLLKSKPKDLKPWIFSNPIYVRE